MYTFTVPGLPQAKGRHRSRVIKTRDGRAFAQHYPDPKTVAFETKVADFARLAGVQRMDGPLVLTVIAVWPCKSKSKRLAYRTPKTTRPDGDNALKAIMDGLIGVAYDDDSIIYSATILKFHGATGELPGVHVKLEGAVTA